MDIHPTGQQTTSRYKWAWGIAILILAVDCFHERLWHQVMYWLHGIPMNILLMLIAVTTAAIIVYLYMHREALRRIPRSSYAPGLALLLAGLMISELGKGFWVPIYGSSLVQSAGLILFLLGLSAALAGWKWTRTLWFPLICLSLVLIKFEMILPDSLKSQLQELMNWQMIYMFRLINLFVSTGIIDNDVQLLSQSGTSHYIPVNIAEGALRLNRVTLHIILGLAVAFLYYRWWLQRLMVVLAILPVWLILNAVSLAVCLLMPERTYPSLHWSPAEIWMMLFGLLFTPVLEVALLASWGWVWKFAIVQTDETQKDETQNAEHKTPQPQANTTTDTAAAVAVSVPKVIASLLLGFVCAALILGLATSLIDTTTRVLSRPQHLALVLVIALVLPIGLQFIFKRRQGAKPGTGALMMPLIAGMLAANLLVVQLLQADPWEAEPASLTRELSALPHKVGTWETYYEPPRLSPDMEDELGTREYLIRDYRDIQTHRGLQLMVQFFGSATGGIPHIPESAFGAAGLEQLHQGYTDLTLNGDVQFDIARSHANPDGNQPVDLHTMNVEALIFTFDGSFRPDNNPIHVISFFVTRDAFLKSPHDVRLAWHGKRNKAFGYYCKVQLTIDDVRDRNEAEALAADFLSDMLPHIMSCMPGSGEPSEAPPPLNTEP